jgi:hypothetical protein
MGYAATASFKHSAKDDAFSKSKGRAGRASLSPNVLARGYRTALSIVL